MNPKISQQSRKRLLGIAFFVFGLFSLLIAQFYKFQILEGEKWSGVAKSQHFFVVKEPFMRGIFISNSSIKKAHPEDPQPFVVDIQKYHLFIDPLSIPREFRADIVSAFENIIDFTVEEQLRFREQFEKRSRSRKVAMWLDGETRDAILQWWRPYAGQNKIARNAIYFVSDYQRSYPFGKLLGQVLHTVQNQKEEETMQALPTGGLELSLNDHLKGKLGKRLMMRSPRHSFETGKMIEPPENGADVYLTINHVLQAIAEEEVEKGVKKCKAKGGWAVMMDPYTGEILALAQYPFFSPHEYKKYFEDPEMIEHTKIKAITDAEEPGSTMKPFTLATTLLANQILEEHGEDPIFDPDEKMSTTNTRFPGRNKELKDLRVHNFLNMNMALQKSSNVYMAQLIQRVIEKFGSDWYRAVLHDIFGFGKPTLVELPAETWGVLPTPGKLHPNNTLEWSAGTPYSLAMGHNVQVSSLQLLRAYAVLVNGGYFVEPTLVRKVTKKDQVLVDHTTDERVRRFPHVLSAKIGGRVVEGMKYVTKKGGAGFRADIFGFTEAGKSSTDEKVINGKYSKTQHIASFMGFTPAKKPKFLLLVSMDEPECKFIPGVGKNHHGSVAAAPVFREIARRSLEYLGTTPDDPHGYPKGDPRHDFEKGDLIRESDELYELYNEWNG